MEQSLLRLGNFFRMSLSAIVILLYIIINRWIFPIYPVFQNISKILCFASVVGIFGGILVFMYGLALTEPAPAAAIFSSNPIVISTISIIFLKESKSVRKIIGIIIGFIGVFIIITEFNLLGFFDRTINWVIYWFSSVIYFGQLVLLLEKLL